MADAITASVSVFTSTMPFIPAKVSALTTIFTPPSGCVDNWVQYYPTGRYSGDVYSGISYGTQRYLACQAWNHEPTYSPGVCPSGHTIRSIWEYQQSSDRLWQAVCCSGGMTYSYGVCQSIYSTSITAVRGAYFPTVSLYTYTGSSNAGSVLTTTQTTVNFDQTMNTTVLTSGTMTADIVVVYWESTDLSLFEPKYASALASRLNLSFTATAMEPSGVQTAKPSSTLGLPSQTGSTTSTGDPSGLSTGAKAGVGVGAALGAIIVAAGIFLLYRRNKRRKQMYNPNHHSSGMAQRSDMPELISASQLGSPR